MSGEYGNAEWRRTAMIAEKKKKGGCNRREFLRTLC